MASIFFSSSRRKILSCSRSPPFIFTLRRLHQPYNSLNESDIQAFSDILGHNPSLLLPASDPIVTAASTDWTGHYGPAPARLLLRPQTTAQVSALLRYCHERRLPIVPQGGKTGLVGGSVPTRAHQEIILQLQQMNQITALDPLMGIVTCQAGVVLQNLQDYCAWIWVPKERVKLGAIFRPTRADRISANTGVWRAMCWVWKSSWPTDAFWITIIVNATI